MAMITGLTKLTLGAEMKALEIEFGSIDAALKKSTNYPVLFAYLAEKLEKHMTTNNIEKVVMYWIYLIRLPIKEVPEELLPLFRSTKEYLKKNLAL